MKKHLRSICFLLIFVLLVSVVLFGCTTKDDTDTAGTTTTRATTTRATTTQATTTKATGETSEETKEVEDPFAEHLVITWSGHWRAYEGGFPEDSETIKIIEDLFNVTINVVSPQGVEGINLMYAEGNMPDWRILLGGPAASEKINQGLIRDFPEEWLRTYMPQRVKEVIEIVGEETWNRTILLDGKCYFVPWTTLPSVQGHVIRQDWLDNVGMEMPKTLDEYEAVLRAFTFNDPNKSGKDDTYGIGGNLHRGHELFTYAFTAHGIGRRAWIVRDGEVTVTCILDEYKQVLKVLNSWYEQGIIDPEFVTDTRAENFDKFYQGLVGVFSGFASYFGTGFYDTMAEWDPNAVVVPLPPVKGPKGLHGVAWQATVQTVQWYVGGQFGARTSDEKVIRIMQIIESVDYDLDLFMRVNNGVEGQDWEWEDKENKLQPKTLITTDEKLNRGLGEFWTLPVYSPKFQQRFFDPKATELTLWFLNLDVPRIVNRWSTDFPYEGNNAIEELYRGDIRTIEQEFLIDAITGRVDIDAEWDNYVNRFLNAGGKAALERWQELYEESN